MIKIVEEEELYDMRTQGKPLEVNIVRVRSGEAAKVTQRVEIEHPGANCTVGQLKQMLRECAAHLLNSSDSVDLHLFSTFADAENQSNEGTYSDTYNDLLGLAKVLTPASLWHY